MWSVALIVGVAVASSLVMLVTGVTLAITFERRRYRKFIQRHTAGIVSSAPEATASDNFGPTTTNPLRGSGLSPRQVANPNLSESSLTACSDVSDPDVVDELRPPSPKTESTIGRKKSLRKTLGGPIKKKHRRSRKWKRTVASQFLAASPLSVITESGDSCQSLPNTPDKESASATNLVPRRLSTTPTPTPQSLSVAKIRRAQASVGKSPTRDSLMDSRSGSGGPLSLRPAAVLRSLSSTSTASSAPEDPLPPLPHIDQSRRDRSVASRARASSASIDSVSSSVLETPKSILRVSDFVNTSQAHSQGLLDFDFGLEPEKVVRKQSPAKLTPRGRSDPRTATVTSLRASVDPCLDNSFVDMRDLGGYSTAVKPLYRGSDNLKDRPTRSQSMFERRREVDQQTKTLMSGALQNAEDPFIADMLTRPKSVEVKLLIQSFEGQAQPERNSSCSLGSNKKGHKRQNCVRISNLPLVATPRKTVFPKIADIEEEQSLEGGSPQNPKRYAVDFTTEDASGSSIIRLFPIPAPPQPVIFKVSIPSTPELVQERRWQHDVILSDRSILDGLSDQTPPRSSSNTPSRFRIENSPILPSPAYTLSKLHSQPRPRQSQVRGPRSPRDKVRGNPMSYLKPYHASNSSRNISSFKKSSASGDFRAPTRISRSIDSGNWFLGPTEQSAVTRCRNAGTVTRANPDTGTNVSTRDGAGVADYTAVPKITSRIPVPILSLSPLRQKQGELLQPQHRQGMSNSFTRSSISGTSIWEDISVHDDDNDDSSCSTPASIRKSYPRSPHPDMPTPTKRNQVLAQYKNGNRDSHRLSASPSPSPHTPRTKLEDYEAYENFINSYGER